MTKLFHKLAKLTAMTENKCLLCGKDIFDNATGFCDDCIDKVVFNNGHTCLRCGTKIAPTQSFCANCNFDTVYFDKAYSPFCYEGDFVKLIYQIKFGGHAGILDVLATYIAFTVNKQGVTFDEICFVPMTEQSQKERGYNQAQILAQRYGELIGKAPVNALVKKKQTQRQEQLGRAERKKNVDNAFAVVDKNLVKNKAILLIDDVKTTGATLNNCAKALKRAGATSVVCVTLASTPEQFVYE